MTLFNLAKDEQAEKINWKAFGVNKKKYLRYKYCHFLTCLSFFIKDVEAESIHSSPLKVLLGNYGGTIKISLFKSIGNKIYAKKKHRLVKKTFNNELKNIKNFLKEFKTLKIDTPTRKGFVNSGIRLSLPFSSFDQFKPNFSMTRDGIPILSYKEFMQYVNKIK